MEYDNIRREQRRHIERIVRKHDGRSGVIVCGRWPLHMFGFRPWTRARIWAGVGPDCGPGVEVHTCERCGVSSITSRHPHWFDLEPGVNHQVKLVVDWRRGPTDDRLIKDYIVRLATGEIRVFVCEGPRSDADATVAEVVLPGFADHGIP